MPGSAFPLPGGFYRGSLGPWFPPRPVKGFPLPRGTVRCYDCLPVPWVDVLRFVSLPTRAELGSFVGRVDLQTPGCCLRRSPLFRRSFPWRREALPSSRITLLPTCPALRPRWCPARSPWRGQDCCLPMSAYRRRWGQLPGLVLGPPLYIFRSSMTRPVFSPHLCFAHRLSAIALRFGCRPGG